MAGAQGVFEAALAGGAEAALNLGLPAPLIDGDAHPRRKLADLADSGLAALADDPRTFTDHTADYLAGALGVRGAVRDAMAALPPAKFERVLHPVFEQDEATLIAVGMTLGGLVGLAQVPLY